MVEKIFGTDFDLPAGEKRIDAKSKLEHLIPYIQTAKKIELILVGQLEQKDAFRVRIMGIHEEK